MKERRWKGEKWRRERKGWEGWGKGRRADEWRKRGTKREQMEREQERKRDEWSWMCYYADDALLFINKHTVLKTMPPFSEEMIDRWRVIRGYLWSLRWTNRRAACHRCVSLSCQLFTPLSFVSFFVLHFSIFFILLFPEFFISSRFLFDFLFFVLFTSGCFSLHLLSSLYFFSDYFNLSSSVIFSFFSLFSFIDFFLFVSHFFLPFHSISPLFPLFSFQLISCFFSISSPISLLWLYVSADVFRCCRVCASHPVITCRKTPSHIHTFSSDECRHLLSHDTWYRVLRVCPDVVLVMTLMSDLAFVFQTCRPDLTGRCFEMASSSCWSFTQMVREFLLLLFLFFFFLLVLCKLLHENAIRNMLLLYISSHRIRSY